MSKQSEDDTPSGQFQADVRGKGPWLLARLSDRRVPGCLLALYTTALLVGALIETPQIARDAGSFAVHTLGFGLMPPLVFWLTSKGRSRIALILLLFLFGGMVEGAQALLSWRSASWLDLTYNGMALLGGSLLSLAGERLLGYRPGSSASEAKRPDHEDPADRHAA